MSEVLTFKSLESCEFKKSCCCRLSVMVLYSQIILLDKTIGLFSFSAPSQY